MLLTLIFLYTEETDLFIPVGTIYSRDIQSLDKMGKPLNVVDLKRDGGKHLQVRVLKKAITVAYIFLYKRS